MKPKVRGITVEELAKTLLEEKGFTIIEKRKRIRRNNVDIAEVDLVAEKDGNLYAIEVKAGKISVTDLRQAYTNAQLINASPLIICRGFADRSAKELAKELNIEVMLLPNYFLFIEPEEVVNLIERSIINVLTRIIEPQVHEIDEDELELLKLFALCKNFPEAVKKSGMSANKLRKLMNRLAQKGFEADPKKYSLLRLQSLITLLLYHLKTHTS